MKTAIATFAAVAFVAPAAAQEWYGNLGYTYYSADDADFSTFTARIGNDFDWATGITSYAQYVGAEAEVLLGIASDEQPNGVDLSLDYSIGGFITGHYPVTDWVEVFGRAGYQFVEVTAVASIAGVSASANEQDDSFALGAGANFSISGPHGVRLGYTYADVTEAHLAEISYVYRFGAN